LKAHIAVAEALVGYDNQSANRSLFWAGEDGQVAQEFVETLLTYAHHYPSLKANDYPAFLGNLMAHEVVRDVEGIGSRIMILGTLEARLLESEVVILAGLNEGTWPGISEVDPWLSHSMRQQFGLPPTERKIGLAAHDFCTCFGAAKVYLTRSIKKDGSPTIPSRWWQRLAALISTSGISFTRTHSQNQPWALISAELDQPTEQISFTPPNPNPPVSARPNQLSVTDVELLKRDPYSIYAKKILHLIPINPLDADLAMAERGQAIHQVFDQFIQSGMDPGSMEAMTYMETLGRDAFGDLLSDARALAFWWPRFLRLSSWFLDQLNQERDQVTMSYTEIEGKIDIPVTKGTIQLKAKADRIDVLATGHVRIIDYKTGGVPSKKDVVQGSSPQLPLEGFILRCGGFNQVPVKEVETLSYWQVTGGHPPGEVISLDHVEELISSAEYGVGRLFEVFLSEETVFLACPNPTLIPNYHAYEHLERLKEWG
jgi:ATP-dependent helicase/nuclease subunit B